ncbi:bifunctional diguanylate cyclase/phosphodiesterase [Nocardioides sp. KR10-350]|uniref:bifunctional diguanylate cyclase/phosphodiesterase n=1 Tax=Nocardioides cheoyonin TaxID=3156615 RepID=UPI0032B4335B
MAARYPRLARVLDALILAAAAAILVVGVVRWLQPPVSVSLFTAVVLLVSAGLVAVLMTSDEPVTVRSVPPIVLGVALAAVAGPRVEPNRSAALGVWVLLVAILYVIVRLRRQLTLARAATVVVAGPVLLAVRDATDLGLGANGRFIAGLAAYGVLTWCVRRLYDHVHGVRIGDALTRRNLIFVALGVGYGVGMLALLNALYATRSDVFHLGVLAGSVVLAGIVVWQTLRVMAYRQLTHALVEAARRTPWPHDQMDDIMLELVRDHVRAESTTIEPEPGGPDALSEEIEPGSFLVVRREPGDFRFGPSERRLVAAVAALGRTAHIRATTERSLFTASVTDPLTGLWDYRHWRTAFLEEMSANRQPGELIGVVFFDLDHFKDFNETYGHLRADEVLATIGQRLRGSSRNWRFARFGGDEFVGLIREVRDERALDEACDQLAQLVAEPIHADGQTLLATVTIGRTISGSAGDHAAALVARADEDLRKRKSARPGPEEGPTDAEMMRSLLEGGLEVALQPIFLLADRTIDGFEALLRGRVGDHGFVSPDQLIEAARRLGTLDVLTQRVAEIAVATVEEASRRIGRALGVSVNLETEQLRWDSELLDWIMLRAQESPARLITEITERGDAAWTEEQYDVVDRLRRGGVESSLDDYGSGQSRLRPVTSRTWHWVKMDRDFLTTEEGGVVMLRHTVDALHELGLQVVLEGLETTEQVALARSLGIEYGQGYVLSPPIPADRLLDEVGPLTGG